jgi:outer membrane immunogenic protein
MKTVLFAAASLVAFAAAASAADLGQSPYKAPAPPPVSDWSGIYAGLEGGYGWGKQTSDSVISGDPFFVVLSTTKSAIPYTLLPTTPIFFTDVAVPSIKQNGWLFGGFFGTQKQWGNLVLGIEGDIDGAAIKGSGTSNASSGSSSLIIFTDSARDLSTFATCVPENQPCFSFNHKASLDSKVDALGSLRTKVGWSFAPNWLIYGTGGAALAHVEETLTSTQSVVIGTGVTNLCTFPGNGCTFSTGSSLSTSGGATMFGWALGGGLDWKHQLDAGSALVFGVEYLHYGFPEQTITLSGNGNSGGILAFRAKESVDAVKGRISYLFSIH